MASLFALDAKAHETWSAYFDRKTAFVRTVENVCEKVATFSVFENDAASALSIVTQKRHRSPFVLRALQACVRGIGPCIF